MIRFKLEKYKGIKSKHRCPSCNKNKVFVRYVDGNDTYLSNEVGRCDREIKCGYHYKPRDFFNNNPSTSPTRYTYHPRTIQYQKLIYLNNNLMLTSLKNYRSNNFIKGLFKELSISEVRYVVNRYYIGTSSRYFEGAVIFWQIDKDWNIRRGKIMSYDPLTLKRQKKINWVNRGMDNLHPQCFYGEHLINDTSRVIGIVESEKTAIISSVKYPEYIWLATGGLQNLNEQKFKVLKDREVVLFPDAGCYNVWKKKISKFRTPNIRISPHLEIHCNDKQKRDGWDIADNILS